MNYMLGLICILLSPLILLPYAVMVLCREVVFYLRRDRSADLPS